MDVIKLVQKVLGVSAVEPKVGPRNPLNQLDVAFIVDTTASMGSVHRPGPSAHAGHAAPAHGGRWNADRPATGDRRVSRSSPARPLVRGAGARLHLRPPRGGENH